MDIVLHRIILIYMLKIELTSPAASEESRKDCEAICKLGLKAKVCDVPKVGAEKY